MYFVFAQAQATQPAIPINLIFIGLLFAIFYFLIIKPQKQKQMALQKMVQALKKNDEVITIGGIHGAIVNVKDNSVVLRIADNVKVEVQKSAIAGLKKVKPEVSEDKIGSST